MSDAAGKLATYRDLANLGDASAEVIHGVVYKAAFPPQERVGWTWWLVDSQRSAPPFEAIEPRIGLLFGDDPE